MVRPAVHRRHRRHHTTNAGWGFWSGDGGKTWAKFATNPPGANTETSTNASIVVTARNQAVWAPSNSVPSYTTNNGASWVPTNLPSLPNVAPGIHRAYHLAADRKNPNKVYAYDSGGAWWAGAGKVYFSNDGGHNFTLSAGSVSAGLAPTTSGSRRSRSTQCRRRSLAGRWQRRVPLNRLWRDLDQAQAPLRRSRAPTHGPTCKAPRPWRWGQGQAGATYSAAVYVVGVVGGVWGVYRSATAAPPGSASTTTHTSTAASV